MLYRYGGGQNVVEFNKKKKILFKQFHFVKPLPANAIAKMQYIYKSQLEVAKWRAASEYDEYMTKKFEEDLKVSFHNEISKSNV